ncbi:MAG TPA: hypothetical protein VGY54_04225 [Polyangiaceae bacterium]|nr:hypothetical protein [Polyangiaceae bacterium]
MRLASALLIGLLSWACASAQTRAPAATGKTRPGDPLVFLLASLRPWPRADSPGLLASTDPTTGRIATYDSALVVLTLLRAGDRVRAARVLQGLAALQSADGGIPFAFTLPEPDRQQRYERAGAIAWVGYAAGEYLDAAPDGPARDVVLQLAHRVGGYLVAHQVTLADDPRDGLVRGGTGTIHYKLEGRTVREVFEPGEVAWTSVEHNIDAYFMLRALARVTGTRAYSDAADRIMRALSARAYDLQMDQFAEGVAPDGPDRTQALDCASWGSIFLSATGDAQRAGKAFAVADERYASHDARSGARGHRPYAHGPLFGDTVLMHHFAPMLPAQTWERLDAVWPEGSAGVALAAWRTGHGDRARAILNALEPLRGPDGSLPTSTIDVPLLLDTHPSVAGTAWAFLVQFELARSDRPTLWAP